jgi:WD40 repeat protein
VAFSPNSQYLASLGAANDGFLYIWSINSRNGSASLYASNKCTSNIAQIAWIGSSLITVGTRHVKVWRIDGSTVSTPIKATSGSISTSASFHRILLGRNCLLGPLLEGIFTSVVALSSSQAFIGSDSGDICLLDDSDNCQRLSRVANAGFGVTSIALNHDGSIVVSGVDGRTRCFDETALLSSKSQQPLEPNPSPEAVQTLPTFTVAMARLGKHMITVDDRRVIRLIHAASINDSTPPKVALQLPAHGGAVLGVRPLLSTDVASFFTYSADGTVLFWTPEGLCKRQITVELGQAESGDDSTVNELKVVRSCSKARVLITGDKLGVLRYVSSQLFCVYLLSHDRVIDEKTGKSIFTLRAHSGEITDIAVYEKNEILVASSGRDRTVQVFRKSQKAWELLQTLDEHVGAVTGVLFTSDGKHLISCSSDRTVVVREGLSRRERGELLTAFAIRRTVTLKATPVSMTLFNDRDDMLLISAVDRTVQKFNLHSGHQSASFKASDSEGGDSVVLSSLIHLCSINGQNILAGVSSTDKSVRLYDESGALVGRDWGHTEGVTDLTTIRSRSPNDSGIDGEVQKSLVTVAADGTVFIWAYDSNNGRSNVRRELSQSMELMGITPTRQPVSTKPPLRRVLSQSEMARFRQNSLEQEDVATPSQSGAAAKRAHRPLERKASRFSLAQTPKLDPSPMTTTGAFDSGRRRLKNRSPSPPSPQRSVRTVSRKPSLETSRMRGRQSTAGAPPTSAAADLSHSTDFVCRTLRSYRKKLSSSSDVLQAETLRELERELALTARAVGERAIKAKGKVDEGIMVKLLSQYSERLIEMLDERFKGLNTSTNSGSSAGEEDAGAGTPGDTRESIEIDDRGSKLVTESSAV